MWCSVVNQRSDQCISTLIVCFMKIFMTSVIEMPHCTATSRTFLPQRGPPYTAPTWSAASRLQEPCTKDNILYITTAYGQDGGLRPPATVLSLSPPDKNPKIVYLGRSIVQQSSILLVLLLSNKLVPF